MDMVMMLIEILELNTSYKNLEKELSEKGVKMIKSLNITDYQNREFVIEDIDGRWIAFGLKEK